MALKTLTNFDSLRACIRLSHHISPMSLEETASYIDHGLEVAHRKEKLFSDATKTEIFKRTNAVARQVNRICYNAIVAGTIEHKDLIDSTDLPADGYDRKSIPSSWGNRTWHVVERPADGNPLRIVALDDVIHGAGAHTTDRRSCFVCTGYNDDLSLWHVFPDPGKKGHPGLVPKDQVQEHHSHVFGDEHRRHRIGGGGKLNIGKPVNKKTVFLPARTDSLSSTIRIRSESC